MSFWSKLFDPFGVVAPAWNSLSGADANYRARMAQEQAQQAQEAQLNEQKTIAKQQADTLAKQQQQTADNINRGKSSIDSAFSQFNEPYFAGIAKTYSDYYTPQVDQQQEIAHDKLTAQLAGQGVLDSTVGANSLATLAKTAADKRGEIANSGQNHANTIRGNVDGAKSQLYADNQSAADPNRIATQATGSATTLANGSNVTPAQPIGDIFSSLLQPIANFATASSNAYTPRRSGAPTSGAGSSALIR